MSFTVVGYQTVITREEAIKILFDNENHETFTTDGEKIVIMGSGTHTKEAVSGHTGGGFKHNFVTNINFVYHQKDVWCAVILTKRPDDRYDGQITFVGSTSLEG